MLTKRPADELPPTTTRLYTVPLRWITTQDECRRPERWQISEDKHAIWVDLIIGILTGLATRGFGNEREDGWWIFLAYSWGSKASSCSPHQRRQDMRIQQNLRYPVPRCTPIYYRRSSDLKSGMKLRMSMESLREKVSVQMGQQMIFWTVY